MQFQVRHHAKPGRGRVIALGISVIRVQVLRCWGLVVLGFRAWGGVPQVELKPSPIKLHTLVTNIYPIFGSHNLRVQ